MPLDDLASFVLVLDLAVFTLIVVLGLIINSHGGAEGQGPHVLKFIEGGE